MKLSSVFATRIQQEWVERQIAFWSKHESDKEIINIARKSFIINTVINLPLILVSIFGIDGMLNTIAYWLAGSAIVVYCLLICVFTVSLYFMHRELSKNKLSLESTKQLFKVLFSAASPWFPNKTANYYNAILVICLTGFYFTIGWTTGIALYLTLMTITHIYAELGRSIIIYESKVQVLNEYMKELVSKF